MVSLGARAPAGKLDFQASKEQQEPLVLVVLLEQQVPREVQEVQVLLVPLAPLEALEPLVCQEQQAQLVPQVQMDRLVHQGHQVLMAMEVS